jgi:hypothetical protein
MILFEDKYTGITHQAILDDAEDPRKYRDGWVPIKTIPYVPDWVK